MALGFGSFFKLLLDGSEKIDNVKTNCNDEFIQFDKNLSITKSKLKKLKTARNAVQDKIKLHFKEMENYTVPKFYIQGSSQIGTIIRDKKDFCDFDVGVYFFKPNSTFETIQKNIKKALENHTNGKVRLLEKCVRVHYSGDFQIDMPIYYTDDNKNFYLGSKNNNWNICDSKFFKNWVLEKTKDDSQTIRLIRYFKAWADNYKYKLPSGLAFTIWVINYKSNDKRDDIAFIQTAANILKNLNNKYLSSSRWKCTMPIEPKDNVLDNLTSAQKTKFKLALEELVKNGVEALHSNSKVNSINKWKKICGKRFNIK